MNTEMKADDVQLINSLFRKVGEDLWIFDKKHLGFLGFYIRYNAQIEEKTISLYVAIVKNGNEMPFAYTTLHEFYAQNFLSTMFLSITTPRELIENYHLTLLEISDLKIKLDNHVENIIINELNKFLELEKNYGKYSN
jgi:hypothetical protein